MAKKQQKKKVGTKQPPLPRPKEFLDLIAPAAVQFNTDSFILGGTYRSVMVLRSYPPTTEQLALLSQLGELGGVTLHLAARQVTAAEENAILHTATNKSRMERGNLNNMKQSVTAEAKLQDVAALINTLRREQEPLLHCSVFLELSANSAEQLRTLRDQVNAMLLRAKLGADPLFLRQRDGFLSSNPAGHNVFGAFAERVLPASSVANLYPMSYSGKTDPCGFYLGNEKYGSNIIVDLDRRTGDKTNASALILGNSGQGKSYLLKFLLCNVLESGKSVISLDSEHEMEELCGNLGGSFVDLLSGRIRINLLEPRHWDDGSEPDDPDAPDAFRGTLLAQHISFLRDIFRVYKDFDTPHIDTLELMVERLYRKWGISDATDFSRMTPTDYPVLADLYDTIEEAYQQFVDCFVTYEERTRTVTTTDKEGNEVETEESYTVAIPITDLETVWANIQAATGLIVTEEHRGNADSIYNLVRYGSSTGTEDWIPGAEVPFIGADGFCSPIGSGWESRVTSEFGYRKDPFTGETRGHTGIDIAVPTGTPVRAALPGVVTTATYNAGGYGYYVMIDHGNGMVTLYAHCSKLLARVGSTVEVGDIVSLSGSTGRSTGPHLHFEVRVNGQRVNPRAYLPTN